MDAKYEKIQSVSFLMACTSAVILAVFFSLGIFTETGEAANIQLQTRINPNDAPVASLIRLPQIGLTRAEKIAAYRQGQAGDKPVFACSNDLQKVKGIGPAIAGQLSEHLRFE